MSTAQHSRHWLWAGGVFAVVACQDRTLNFLPDSPPAAAAAGAPGLVAGAGGSAGDPLSSAGNNSAGQPIGGGADIGGSSFGGGDSGAGGSFSGDGSGGAQSGAGHGGAGGAGAGGAGGVTCQSDADCAPPTPGCSPTAHRCQQCSKSSPCPNGQVCSVDDGECGS